MSIELARDHRVTNGTIAYMKWFYGQAAAVFSRSSAYLFNLRDLGVAGRVACARSFRALNI